MRTELDQFLAHLRNERQLSDHTISNYQRDLLALLEELDRTNVKDWKDVSAHHLRSYITGAFRAGKSGKTLQRHLSSIRTLFNWKKDLEPKEKWDRKSRKIDLEKLKKDVQENPDKYQYERAKEFGVSRWGIGKALKKLGISYKKNSKSSQSGCRDKIYILPQD